MTEKPTIQELYEALEVIEDSLNLTGSGPVKEASIKYLKDNFYSTDFKKGLEVVVFGEEYPEDLKARVIKVLAILSDQQNN